MHADPLRNLPRKPLPPGLLNNLRITASREAQRRRRRASAEAFMKYLRGELRLLFDNLMRPYAVPAAGGVASAVVLFALLTPALTFDRTVHASSDVPTALSTEVTIESSISFGIGEAGDFMVDVWVDDQGKMTSYAIPAGQPWVMSAEDLRRLENTLLFTRFTPATLFGQPAAGRVRLTIRRSYLDVHD